MKKEKNKFSFNISISSLCSAGQEGKTSILKKAETFISFNIDEPDEEVKNIVKKDCNHEENCPNDVSKLERNTSEEGISFMNDKKLTRVDEIR